MATETEEHKILMLLDSLVLLWDFSIDLMTWIVNVD